MSREKTINLDYVDVSDIHPDLDPRIAKLVKAVRDRGHRTFGSCQGGLGDDRHIHKFPWVTVSGLVFEDNPAYQDLRRELDEFNKRGGDNIRWTIDQGAIQPERSALNRQELEKLQASADKLAEFLFGG